MACAAACLLLLAGCSQDTYSAAQMNDTSSWTCVQGSTGMQLKNSDDRLEQSVETFLMPYEAVVTEKDVSEQEAREQACRLMSEMFQDVEGVTIACQQQEDGILCVLNVDYSKADVARLKEAGLDKMIGLAEGYVSASKTLNTLKEQGFACQAAD